MNDILNRFERNGAEECSVVVGLLREEELLTYGYKGDPRSFFQIKLHPWCEAGGEAQKTALLVEVAGPISKYLAQFISDRPVALKIRMLPNPDLYDEACGFRYPGAELLEVLDSPFADDVKTLGNSLGWPVSIVTDEFGKLTLDRELSCFIGTARWMSKEVKLMIRGNDRDYPHASLAHACAVWAKPRQWHSAMESLMIGELLPFKNHLRLDPEMRDPDAAAPITPEAFLKRAKLFAVDVRSNGGIEFVYGSDLFYGNVMVISGWVSTGLHAVRVEGLKDLPEWPVKRRRSLWRPSTWFSFFKS